MNLQTGFYVVLASFAVFLAYLAAVFIVFREVPKSLSNTYYMFQEKKDGLKWLFPALIAVMVFTLMPAWLELSDGSNWQFLSFLCPASLLFVGAAPAFKSSNLESTVHTVAALLSAFFGLAWVLVFCTFGLWFVLVSFMCIYLLSIFTNSYQTSYTFWLEMVAFLAVYMGIMVTYAASF